MPWKSPMPGAPKEFVIWGETIESWKEIIGGLILRVVVVLLCTGLFFGGLYALVRFVKWAWES